MTQLYTNNSITLTTKPLTPDDTLITVREGTGDAFPEIVDAGDFFLLTLENQNGTIREITRVIARDGDKFTVIRGDEGFEKLAWGINTIADSRVTAETLRRLASIEYVETSIANNPGPTGPIGVQGVQGTQGIQGEQGIQGIQGLTGAKGDKGDKGDQGIKGDAGDDGLDGNEGAQGVQGLQGSRGESFVVDESDTLTTPKVASIQAQVDASIEDVYFLVVTTDSRIDQNVPIELSGDMSGHLVMYNGTYWTDFGQFTGTEGAQGENGSQGIQGLTGTKGDQGVQGDTGSAGSNGTNGADGATGSQGIQGEQGTQGTQGDAGSIGATGPQGIQGFTGNVGAKGDEGVAGYGLYAMARTDADGTIRSSIGLTVLKIGVGEYQYSFTTSTLSNKYLVSATAYNLDLHNDTNIYIFDTTPDGFTLKIGDGDNAQIEDVFVDEEHSVIITTESGMPSSITTVYQSWLALGNVGTEQDFIDSLIGPQGTQGDKGDAGDSFNVDAIGDLSGRDSHDDEDTGFAYFDSANGNLYIKDSSANADWSLPIPFGKGEKGDTGASGNDGSQGIQGTKGDTGDTGLQGDQGIQGFQGAKGDTGNASTLIFGTEFHQAESLGITTSNAIVMLGKTKLTTASLPAGQYRIGWSYTWNHNETRNDFLGQVIVDGVDVISAIRQEPSDSNGNNGSTGSDQSYNHSGFAYVTLTAGVHDIDIEFASSSSGIDSSIWDARLELWRVA